jgi:hypothetical protein
MPADKFFQKTAPSVWRVYTYDADGISFGQGSAVVIDKETLITNCHVLAKAKRFVIRKENVSFDAKLQHIDVERDLCQITARNLTAPAVPLGDSDKLAVGQKVYTLGNPEGLELSLSEGLVSALRQDEETGLKYIQTTAPFSQGSSGGGLFDEEGRLIGITTLIHKRGQNLNFAMPINYLQEVPARSAAALAKRYAAAAVPVRTDVPQDGAQVTRAEGDSSMPVSRKSLAASGYADVNDVARLVAVNPRAKEAYERFLTKPFPRAFALSENGGWFISAGIKRKDPALSIDPAIRIVPDCEKRHQRRCYLYAVDDIVVWNTANVIELKDRPAKTAAPAATTPAPAADGPEVMTVIVPPAAPATAAVQVPAPEQPPVKLEHMFVRPASSGFAPTTDTNAIPFVSMKARDGFVRYLNLRAPKAFAIGGDGSWSYISNDPRAMRTAIERCEARGATCWLYAVDNDVVWREELASRARTFQLVTR